MQTFEATRPPSARRLRIARAATEYAIEYAKERHVLGRPIIKNQGIAFMLADMATEEATCAHLEGGVARKAACVQERRRFDGQNEGRPGGTGSRSGRSRSSAATATPVSTQSSAGIATPRSTTSSKAPSRSSSAVISRAISGCGSSSRFFGRYRLGRCRRAPECEQRTPADQTGGRAPLPRHCHCRDRRRLRQQHGDDVRPLSSRPGPINDDAPDHPAVHHGGSCDNHRRRRPPASHRRRRPRPLRGHRLRRTELVHRQRRAMGGRSDARGVIDSSRLEWSGTIVTLAADFRRSAAWSTARWPGRRNSN